MWLRCVVQEWWNATTIGEYWRLWNMPVHKWMLRHVYFPCIRHGIGKFYAGVQCSRGVVHAMHNAVPAQPAC